MHSSITLYKIIKTYEDVTNATIVLLKRSFGIIRKVQRWSIDKITRTITIIKGSHLPISLASATMTSTTFFVLERSTFVRWVVLWNQLHKLIWTDAYLIMIIKKSTSRLAWFSDFQGKNSTHSIHRWEWCRKLGSRGNFMKTIIVYVDKMFHERISHSLGLGFCSFLLLVRLKKRGKRYFSWYLVIFWFMIDYFWIHFIINTKTNNFGA